jgi:hypothetical protein
MEPAEAAFDTVIHRVKHAVDPILCAASGIDLNNIRKR